MTSRNEITGDAIQTKIASEAYRDNYDRIFGKKPVGRTDKDSLPVAYDGKADAVDEKAELNSAIDTAMKAIGE